MLKTIIRLTSTRNVLLPNLQLLQSRSESLVGTNPRVLSLASINRTKESTNESVQNETNPTNKHHNPFAQKTDTKATAAEAPISGEERTKLLKVLQLEADIAHQEGRRVPALESITDENWTFILTLPSKSARYKYYAYLWQIGVKKQAKESKKEERAVKILERKEEMRKEREENQHILYGLAHTTLFLRIYDSTINHFLNSRLVRAMQFSPKIVLDCSYDQHMTRREAQNAAKQMMLCFAENRAHDDPFDMHYCNVNLNSISMKALNRYIPTMLNPEFPMNVHDKCFTEIFPKENLVYLTPHCRTDLETYNYDDVYIIGAMVDTVNNEPLSLAKAKRLGLRMARLPLDRYLQWGSGSGKSLTLNQMVNILLDLKVTKDWPQALRHVPRRKVVDMAADVRRQTRTLEKRTQQLNFNLKDILKENDENERDFQRPKVRTHTKNLQFNLETWGSKKEN